MFSERPFFIFNFVKNVGKIQPPLSLQQQTLTKNEGTLIFISRNREAELLNRFPRRYYVASKPGNISHLIDINIAAIFPDGIELFFRSQLG